MLFNTLNRRMSNTGHTITIPVAPEVVAVIRSIAALITQCDVMLLLAAYTTVELQIALPGTMILLETDETASFSL